MKRHLVAVALVAGLAFAAACGSDKKVTTEPPPGPPSDTGDTTLPPPDTVQLQIAATVGKVTFPDGNTAQGGQGDPVDGIGCGAMAGDSYHIHVHLSLYVNGEQLAIPKAIGVVKPTISNGFVLGADPDGGCFYWVHTHDATGIIHVEPPAEVQVKLGELFDLWGQPLSSTGVAGFDGTVTVFVDGKKYTDDPRDILFEAHKQIALEVGTPVVTPDFYVFPETY